MPNRISKYRVLTSEETWVKGDGWGEGIPSHSRWFSRLLMFGYVFNTNVQSGLGKAVNAMEEEIRYSKPRVLTWSWFSVDATSDQ